MIATLAAIGKLVALLCRIFTHWEVAKRAKQVSSATREKTLRHLRRARWGNHGDGAGDGRADRLHEDDGFRRD